MRGVVTGGTGKNAAVDGLSVCGKTGTAEVSSSGKFKPHAWFTGFVVGAAHPYAITVIIENGGGGGKITASRGRRHNRKNDENSVIDRTPRIIRKQQIYHHAVAFYAVFLLVELQVIIIHVIYGFLYGAFEAVPNRHCNP